MGRAGPRGTAGRVSLEGRIRGDTSGTDPYYLRRQEVKGGQTRMALS
jgi:hypothetical protein